MARGERRQCDDGAVWARVADEIFVTTKYLQEAVGRPTDLTALLHSGPPRGGWSAALSKVEHYGVQRVTGDGRCMFRALVKGMAKNKGIPLTPREEVQDADDLRMAVKEVICDSAAERQKYEEAVIAITVEQSLKRLGSNFFFFCFDDIN
ncbi:hypothetical protein PR202_ga26261 [Eleusine coracana subsp. coracana]|uniref:Ubiquitin thioesterase OTU n=1 Tax=Eleusine coracana subsp. coracana TaxID=191504 RepID=A0AAV5DEF8_ELECO|nr:hypothetical protein PR202_ga26261 [Eleusine coracana subsp. coracana]